jgi:hypothetical protein
MFRHAGYLHAVFTYISRCVLLGMQCIGTQCIGRVMACSVNAVL